MTRRYMFCGADPSPRDDLLSEATEAVPDETGEPASGNGFVVRTVATVALAVAVVCTPMSAALGLAIPDGPVVVGLGFDDDDPIAQAVRTVTADGEPPSDAARLGAERLVDRFRAGGLDPDRAVADPDGGIAIYVFGSDVLAGGARARYGRVAAMNDGSIVAACVDRTQNQDEAWDVRSDGVDGAVERIRVFIEG